MKKKMCSWVLVLTGVLGYGIQGSNAQESAGQSAYEIYGCFQCHGYVGQGSFAGLRLAPNPMPYEDFVDVVRRPYNVMPAYSPKVLSDQTMAEIYAYLESIPEPPPLDAIPLLQLD